jgi:lipid II:glycine glycyltransferase (peptidoglycan interpeptide bridge formation enzyme)
MLMKNDNYSSEAGLIPEKNWYHYLGLFDDANLYQTLSYGKYSKGGKQLTHFILKDGDKVIAIAQLRLFLIPLLNRGIAYLFRGPVWKLKGKDECVETLDKMLKALYNEFVTKRKLVLIVAPNLFEKEDSDYESVFIRNNFNRGDQSIRRTTILLDLSKSMNELRKSLRRSWRQNLTKAEQNDLMIEGESKNSFSILSDIHSALVSRKGFRTDLTIDNFRKIQIDLPENYKLNVILCKNRDEYVSGLIGAAIGDTGLALIGGTSANGLQFSPNSFYLLMWEMCEWARNAGCRWFDLGGINPNKNPGVYQFKSGMRGKKMTYLSNYQASKFGISCFLFKLLNIVLWIRNKLR